jgi:hypothetical protein
MTLIIFILGISAVCAAPFALSAAGDWWVERRERKEVERQARIDAALRDFLKPIVDRMTPAHYIALAIGAMNTK